MSGILLLAVAPAVSPCSSRFCSIKNLLLSPMPKTSHR